MASRVSREAASSMIQLCSVKDDVPMYVVGVNHTEYKSTDTVVAWHPDVNLFCAVKKQRRFLQLRML